MLDGRDSPKYLDFCFLDYYSKLIDMNKPIDQKKIIHSNNYYAFFIKKESLSDPKFTQSVIDEYYSILKEPRKSIKMRNRWNFISSQRKAWESSMKRHWSKYMIGYL